MVIPDPSVQLANLRAGKIHSMGVSKSQYSMIKETSNLKLFSYSGNHQVGLRFNNAKGPFQDIRVRKAVSHAIDRKAIIAGTQFGQAIPASCMYPGDHWCHNPELNPVPYNPELARKLLAEAGYPNGLTVKGHGGNTADAMVYTEAIKNMLAQVGVNWQVDALDTAAGSDRVKNLEFDLYAAGWSWIYDPDLQASSLYLPTGGWNHGRVNNEKLTELIEAGVKEVDLLKRQKIYFELEKVLYDNYIDVWVYWPMDITAQRQNVMGWNLSMYLKGREANYWSHPMWFKDGKP